MSLENATTPEGFGAFDAGNTSRSRGGTSLAAPIHLTAGLSSYIAMLLIGMACALCISTYVHFAQTWDEPEHLAAGLQLLDKGIYSYDIQHPPLGRVAIALGPYLDGARSYGEPGPSGVQEGQDILYRTGKYDEYLRLARLGTLPFLIVLLGSTWLWARRYFGAPEAAVAVFLLCTTPPLLGHAALATLDVPGAALCTLGFYLLLRWYETPSFRWACAAALVSGLAIGTKLSGLPFIGLAASAWALAFLWTALAKSPNRLRSARLWLSAASMPPLALFTATLCYGLKFKYLVDLQHPVNTALDWLTGTHGVAHDVVYRIAQKIPLPVGTEQLVWSIQSLLWHNTYGHLSYFLGHTGQSGWWDFYPVALSVKTPLAFLMAAVFGLGYLLLQCRKDAAAGERPRLRWFRAAPTIAFVAILVFCCAYSRINIGVRHVVILYPLMAIAAAAAIVAMWRHTEHWAVRTVLISLMAWQLSSLWSAYPDYLPYFNALAGDHPERILVDSDLDWGQDLRRLEYRLQQLHIKTFGLVYLGSADLAAEHLDGARLVKPFAPASGWVAVSLYAKSVVAGGRAYAWLDHYLPKERIGKSMVLYFIPERLP
jgi:hypothetical protein